MFSAVVHVERGPEALALTLAALVSGVAEGVIADAVICTALDDDRIATIAEAMGADLVRLERGQEPFATGAARARREWVICLADGDVLGEGWTRALDRFAFAAATADAPPLGRFRREPRRVADMLAAFLPPRPRAGEVAHVKRLRNPRRGGVVSIAASLRREAIPGST